MKRGWYTLISDIDKLLTVAPWAWGWDLQPAQFVYVQHVDDSGSAQVWFSRYLTGVLPIEVLLPYTPLEAKQS